MCETRLALLLNDTEKAILQALAESYGYKDYGTFLHRQIHALPGLIKREFICNKNVVDKREKKIPISKETLAFYQRLACSHSTTVLSVVHKYIVFPNIKSYMIGEIP